LIALLRFLNFLILKFADEQLLESKQFSMPLKHLCKIVFKEATYTFSTPVNVHTIGSFATNTHIYSASTLSCDLAVEMSAEFFNERDYLNYKYFIKKNLYLFNVHSQLTSLKKYAKLKFTFEADHSASYSPVMCIFFEDEDFEIRLRCVPEASAFKPARFLPNQANVRKDFYRKNLTASVELEKVLSNGEEAQDELTPIYNYQMLSDLTTVANSQYLKSSFNDSKSILDAIKMLKLWLFKRQLNTVRYEILKKKIRAHLF
jgi:U3 small nucleolar RNA-associated protein 22